MVALTFDLVGNTDHGEKLSTEANCKGMSNRRGKRERSFTSHVKRKSYD
jgi:hypothetical protein